MFDLALRFVLGVIFFFLSTPGGMAQEAVLEEARAEVFVATETGEDDRQAALLLDEAVLTLGAESWAETENNGGGSKQVKRNQKRTSTVARLISKCHLTNALSPKKMSKGMAKHPATQDARQERTKTVRFLQLAALAC